MLPSLHRKKPAALIGAAGFFVGACAEQASYPWSVVPGDNPEAVHEFVATGLARGWLLDDELPGFGVIAAQPEPGGLDRRDRDVLRWRGFAIYFSNGPVESFETHDGDLFVASDHDSALFSVDGSALMRTSLALPGRIAGRPIVISGDRSTIAWVTAGSIEIARDLERVCSVLHPPDPVDLFALSSDGTYVFAVVGEDLIRFTCGSEEWIADLPPGWGAFSILPSPEADWVAVNVVGMRDPGHEARCLNAYQDWRSLVYRVEDGSALTIDRWISEWQSGAF